MNPRLSGGLVVLVVLIALGVRTFSPRRDVTVYPIMVRDGRTTPLNRSVYRVDTDTQTVMHWTPGVVDVPTRLIDCVVRDFDNWRCQHSDRSAALVMENGEFRSESADPSTPIDTNYVGWVRWHWLYWSAVAR